MGWQTDRLALFGLDGAIPAAPAVPSTEKEPPACLILGCDVPAIDIVYCADHRRMADDGSLWLRCVYDNGHAPVAPNDPIVCAEHRAYLEPSSMPTDNIEAPVNDEMEGCCSNSQPCPEHFDLGFEAHREAALDRHLEGR